MLGPAKSTLIASLAIINFIGVFSAAVSLLLASMNRVHSELRNVISHPNKAQITLYTFVAVAKSNNNR